jgi:integrase
MSKEQRPKAVNGNGTVERRGKEWWARISLPDGRRKRMPIPNSEKMSEAMAREKAAVYSEQARTGKLIFDDRPRRGAAVATGPGTTVRQVGEGWTNGSLFERFGPVNRLRELAGDYINKVTLEKHVYRVKTRGQNAPDFGDLRAADVTERDCELVTAAQPKTHRAQTRLHTYIRMRRLFELSIYPLRLRKDNPVSRYLRPERDADKLFCFLYPVEVLALLGGRSEAGDVVVPLGRRVLYALAVYTGQRKGSLFALKWQHVDFDHGTLASFRTKTGRAQYFVGDPGLMVLLKAWHELCGKPEADKPIVAGVDYEPKRLATALRDDLKAVGVTRGILFEENADNVEALRFHDLRSTFCTWARRAGKSDAWISERTGHELTGDMINRYDRGAQTLEDLAYAPFPSLVGVVPELTAPPPLATTLATTSEPEPEAVEETETIPPVYQSGRGDSNPRPLDPQYESGGVGVSRDQ